MDYEKLYKEALDKAQKELQCCGTLDCDAAKKIFRLFPELKESDDERISREITEFLVDFNNGEYERPNENTIDSWLSWLEKQGEKDSQVILPTFTFDDILALQCCMRAMSKNDELYKKLQSLHDRLHEVYGFEKQGEQNTAWNEDDEKKRTLLINILEVNHPCEYFKVNPTNTSNMEAVCTEELISWLKSIKGKVLSQPKQGEPKQIEEYDVPNTPIKDSEEVTSRMKYIDENLKPIAEFIIGYANWDLRKDEWNQPVATVPLFRVLDALIQNGKQYTEEYPVVDNNTKPKFKVGDWITDGEYIWKITNIKQLDYILQSQNGDIVDDIIYYVDEHFRLWTINDAKDGDVLASHECYVIFKEIDGLNIKCYCTYHYLGLNPSLYINTLQNKTAFSPAVKEQRDFLFQKIKETGYTWNTEKKELIKNM